MKWNVECKTNDGHVGNNGFEKWPLIYSGNGRAKPNLTRMAANDSYKFFSTVIKSL